MAPMEWVIIAIVIMAIGVVLWAQFVREPETKNVEAEAEELMDEVDFWIEAHRAKLTGENRFLLDRTVLRAAFPEYSEEAVLRVWKDLVRQRIVMIDPLDGATCIK